MDFPSFPTLFQIARNEALVRNASLTRDAIEREGSDANILIAAACAAADEVVGQLTRVAAGLYLDSATGDQLDRLLLDRYGLLRKTAAAAQGTVSFSTTTPAVASFVIPAGTLLATSSGLRFATIQAATFDSGSTGPLYVGVRSLLAGADQQAAIGTITNIIGQILTQPTDLAVTNTEATFGAADAESDADFRERGRAFYTTVQRGTLAALEQGALSVPGVVKANAYEVVDYNGHANGYVALAIADQFTDTLADLSSVPPVYATQSLQLAQDVYNALQDYRPAGVYVKVQVAQVVLQQVLLALSFDATADVTSVSNSARSVIVEYINNLSPGDAVSRTAMLTALRTVQGLVFSDNPQPAEVILSPTADVTLNPLQVARTTLALVKAYNNPSTAPII